jgi:hypothetical protein
MIFLNFKKSFQSMRSEYTLRRYFEKLPDVSYFTDLRQTRSAKNIPKTGLKTSLNGSY